MQYLKVGIGDNDFWKEYHDVAELILREYRWFNDGSITEEQFPMLRLLIADYVYACVQIKYTVQANILGTISKEYFIPNLEIVDTVPEEGYGGEYYYVPLTYDDDAEVLMR